MNFDPLISVVTNAATYISEKLADALYDRLVRLRESHHAELLQISDTFGDPVSLAKVYVEPNCQNVNPANINEDEPDAIVTTPIFKKLNSFFNGEFRGEPDGRNQLVVLSDAGMGKTSLLMIIKLSHIVGYQQPGLWPTSKHCALLKIGETTLEDIKALKDKSSTILLLDALDEDPSAWNNLETRLRVLLDASKKFYRVVISCRTQFFPDQRTRMVGDSEKVEIGGFKCPLIYLSLFDREQVAAFLKKLYPDYRSNDDSLQKLVRSMEIILKIGTLSLRPMLLAHIDDLIRYENAVWNEYTTFETLIDSWLSREERKPNSHVRKEFLGQAATILACAMQAKGQRSLDTTSFSHFLQIYPELKQLGYAEIGGRSLLNRNSKGEYRFCHYTIQEFLIAQSLIHPDKRFSSFELKLTDRVLAFLSGYVLGKYGEQRSRFQQGQLVLDGLNLSSQNLAYAKLHGASCVGCDFSGARLNGAFLSGADFSDANLTGANVDGADMETALLYRTRIANTELWKASCNGMRLKQVDFSKFPFEQSRFVGVILENVEFLDRVIEDADFRKTRFDKCVFRKVKFSRCNLSSTVFAGCSFESVTFDGEKLAGASFHGENLKGASFLNAVLVKADFSEAELGEVDLRGANLSEAKMVMAKVKGAQLNGAVMRNANLTRANFTGAVVEGVDVFRRGASTARFEKTVLPDGTSRTSNIVQRVAN